MNQIQKIIQGLEILSKYGTEVYTADFNLAAGGNQVTPEDSVKLRELGWKELEDFMWNYNT